MILGFFIGSTIGIFAMALLSVNAYEKGYNDGRSGQYD